jgi:MFS transporter, PAT family, solute carrier family 33 (acetyl-CoA transportor), member 1
MQFNAQMTFFAKRVDPAIGGSYMTLLNTAANLGGTWPASFVMWLVGVLSKDPQCSTDIITGVETCVAGRDPFFVLQLVFSLLGCLWILVLGKRVQLVSELNDDAWRTHLLDDKVYDEESLLSSVDVVLKPSEDSAKRE